jgi:hypothetical protein
MSSPTGYAARDDDGREQDWPSLSSTDRALSPSTVTASACSLSSAWSPSEATRFGAASEAGPSAAAAAGVVDDPALEWAIRESLRVSDAQQELVAAQPGARVEDGRIVPPDIGRAQPVTSLIGEYEHSARGALWTARR